MATESICLFVHKCQFGHRKYMLIWTSMSKSMKCKIFWFNLNVKWGSVASKCRTPDNWHNFMINIIKTSYFSQNKPKRNTSRDRCRSCWLLISVNCRSQLIVDFSRLLIVNLSWLLISDNCWSRDVLRVRKWEREMFWGFDDRRTDNASC